MGADMDMLASGRVRLTRQDLIRWEHDIKDALAAFLPFGSYGLYFPRRAQGGREARAAAGELVLLKAERRILLPLFHGNQTLGVFVATGLPARAFSVSPDIYRAAARLVMDRLWLTKAALSDPLTGLANAAAFEKHLLRQVELIESCLFPSAANCVDPGLTAFSGRLALIVLNLDRYRPLAEGQGHLFGEGCLAEVADALAAHLPETAEAARLGADEFAVLWPDASPAAALKLADKLRAAVAGLEFSTPVTEQPLRITASLGLASYPADLSGPQLRASAAERVRVLLAKARRAVDGAKEQGRNRCLAFGRLLEDGGSVLEVLPLGRLVISLGRTADAREGLRFVVQGRPRDGAAGHGATHPALYPAIYKGEVLLSQVRQEVGFAEVLHLADPAWPIEPGDRLALAADDSRMAAEQAAAGGEAPRRDLLTGLYAYADFQAAMARAARAAPGCMLALVRLSGHEAEGDFVAEAERAMGKVAELCRDVLAKALGAQEVLAGRCGITGLSLFLDGPAGADPAACLSAFQDICRQAAERHGLSLAAGLAAHPFLTFSSADLPENCRKALDHALLLPAAPKVAVCDAVSLNVSADRLFARDDIYGAVEEYKLSLLADPDNLLAANSLGICYARLGRHEPARQLFARVRQAQPGNLMAHYNYGSVCLRLGDAAEARQAFTRCLELDPGSGYSLVRLGLLAEMDGDPAAARARYLAAAEAEAGAGLAMRCLARLELAEGRTEEARELLHQALLRNPGDAAAMQLMAAMYLDTGQDPEIAESLARRSVAIRPEKPGYWMTLARALEAGGKPDEARRALAKAGE